MFKKRGSVDILDIPDLHRRKLIKLPEPEKLESTAITKDGFFDFSQGNTNQNTEEIKKEETPASFLNNFASIGANEQTTIVQTKEEDTKDLKWRIENLEFKLEQLIERVNSINK